MTAATTWAERTRPGFVQRSIHASLSLSLYFVFVLSSQGILNFILMPSLVVGSLVFSFILPSALGAPQIHHELEYISMLLNLYYSLRCEAWVCTLASNSCRIIDQLRATIGGKANRHFADLSVETCHHPPCLVGITEAPYRWMV